VIALQGPGADLVLQTRKWPEAMMSKVPEAGGLTCLDVVENL